MKIWQLAPEGEAKPETATPVVKCPNCQQPVKTWMQWFGEDCPALAAEPLRINSGHQITWAERIALPLDEKEAQ
mgnify:CR=1 FL=1